MHLTRSDTTKQDYLQQQLMENEALLEQSGQQGLNPEQCGSTGHPDDLAACRSRFGPRHRAVVLVSEIA